MKKILSILLTALVLLTVAVSCAQDVTVDAQLYNKVDTEVFMLNGKYYATLQEAVNARLGKAKAAGDNDDVIYLRKNAAGPGAVINDPNTPVVIDFAGCTYSFTDVTATQGSTTGTFGLSISGGSEVTLKGTSTMTLFDSTANLTMVYVSGSNSSLVIEDAPKMEVKENQYIFWATDGATLTIGGETTMTGGLAATGTAEKTPLVLIKDGAKADVSNMKLESAKVIPNSTEDFKVSTLESSGDSKIINSGSGNVTVTKSEGTVVVQNTGEGTVKVDENTITQGEAKEIDNGQVTPTVVTVSVAMIGTKEYTDIEEAIAQGNGKTIKLVSNITDNNISSPADAVVTVDLNGKQVGTNDDPVAILIDTNGEFYIQNISETVGLVYINTGVTPPSPDQLIIYGGKYNIDVSPYVAEGYVAVQSGSTWTVVPVFASGKGTEEDPFIIANAEQLGLFRDSVNQGRTYEDSFIKLNSDIALTGTWTPIGNGYRNGSVIVGKVFMGTFDGSNLTISGLSHEGYVPDPASVTDSNEYTYGLFGVVNGATIKNVKLTNVNINGGDLTENAGGIVGFAVGGATIYNCKVEGTVTGNNGVGGIVGRAYGTVTIDSCKNVASVTGSKNVGGIAGFVSPLADGTITINECKNEGAVTRNASSQGGNAAGIACYGCGGPSVGTGSVIIIDNENSGEITAPGCSPAYYAALTSYGPSYTSGTVNIQPEPQ